MAPQELLKTFLTETNAWKRILPLDSVSDDDLKDLARSFYPKIVHSAPRGTIKYIEPAIAPSDLVGHCSSKLSDTEIQDFSDFTISSFYDAHNKHYSKSEVDVFRDHQKVFFSRSYFCIKHSLNKETVAFLAVGKIESHPYFNEDVWHIGYAGISAKIAIRSDREKIKNDWSQLLYQLNKENRVVSIIDYFNTPSLKAAQVLNMKPEVFRLDPRT